MYRTILLLQKGGNADMPRRKPGCNVVLPIPMGYATCTVCALTERTKGLARNSISVYPSTYRNCPTCGSVCKQSRASQDITNGSSKEVGHITMEADHDRL